MLDHSDQDEALGPALRAAKAVALTRQPISPQAQALDAAACLLIEANEGRKYKRGDAARERLTRAVSAFLGALLSVDREEWIRHSTDRSAFTGGPVSYRNFAAAWGGMEKAGLIERKGGHAHLTTAFGTPRVVQRYETRFRATPALWALANSHGVDGARGHYGQVEDVGRAVVDPITLRGFSEWVRGRGKVDGAPIKFDKAARGLQGVVRDVERLNAFWQDHTLTGGVHRGFTRIFHTDGTSAEGYGWDMGGRLYSVGAGNYQTIKEEDRAQMRIDREPVVELDVQASHLTVFMARSGAPLDVYSADDPYQTGPLAAFPRRAVKAYIATTFGRGEPPARWGQEADAVAMSCPIEEVARAVHAVYPALANLKDPRIWAKLQFAESQAVIRALLDLADQGIPALPVHDSIIVSVSEVAQARDALRAGYALVVGAEPRITASPHRVQVSVPLGHDPWDF
jgi:hypothetical protein